MRAAGHAEAMHRSGQSERSDELVRASYRQGLLQRKVTLEAVRAWPGLSGYVVTGPRRRYPHQHGGHVGRAGPEKVRAGAIPRLQRGPGAAAGLGPPADVGGRRRPPGLLGPPTDSYRAGTTVRAHLLVSNYSPFRGRARVAWQVGTPDQPRLATGAAMAKLGAGRVQEVALAEFTVPEVTRPARMVLQARIQAGTEAYSNVWSLWAYPAAPRLGVGPFGLMDPLGALSGLPATAEACARPTASMGACLPLRRFWSAACGRRGWRCGWQRAAGLSCCNRRRDRRVRCQPSSAPTGARRSSGSSPTRRGGILTTNTIRACSSMEWRRIARSTLPPWRRVRLLSCAGWIPVAWMCTSTSPRWHGATAKEAVPVAGPSGRRLRSESDCYQPAAATGPGGSAGRHRPQPGGSLPAGGLAAVSTG